jgi:hypothetical protein
MRPETTMRAISRQYIARALRGALVIAVAASSAACYHYTVVSGAPAAAQKIDIPWQKAWVLGLVPPDTINSQQTCPQGIAQFETKHSFLNRLVSGITYSLFTPMHPTVTCASGPVAR